MKKIEKKSSQNAKQEEFEHQDSFLEKSYTAESYILNNIEMFKKYGIALAVIIALFVFYIQYSNQTEVEANSQFGIAMVDYKAANFDGAKTKLDLIKEEFSGTEAAERAKYILGKIYLKDGLNEAARQEFMDFSGSDPLFKAASLAALANSYENDKNFTEAANYFEQAAAIEIREEIQIDYSISAAINFELAKNADSAKKIYEKLLADHKDFRKKSLVEQKLELL